MSKTISLHTVQKSIALAVIILFCFAFQLNATHNRAGEISYVHAPLPGEEYRFEFTITTYTKTGGSSDDADRDSLLVFWGDGQSENVPRTNGNGEPFPGLFIKKNIYQAFHTYPGFFPFYVVSMTDPNRNDGIVNINGGNSVNVEFYLEDTLFLLNPLFYGYNNSPELLQPPIDYGEVNYPFIHNPNAYDIDGDSLVFELLQPHEGQGEPVPNYAFPNEIVPGGNNNISLNANTGEFIWDSPQQTGEYNIAFLITEYRNGIKIGTMIRDMQISILDTNNEPPELTNLNDTCITIGENLIIEVNATDPNFGQNVTLTAFGGPLEVSPNAATFIVNGASTNPAEGVFSWNTVCQHIFSGDYTVVFRAEDDFFFSGQPVPLSDLETWLIHLQPPPVEGLQAIASAGKINLTWQEPYTCSELDKFVGFTVWRKAGCDLSELNTCDQSLESFGYTKLAEDITTYNFEDSTPSTGVEYTYRVTAKFADVLTASGTPLNISISAPSAGVCESLPRDLPIILNVSVLSTDASNGEMFVRWAKPLGTELDTIVNPPPYEYILLESTDGSSFNQVALFTANSFSEANDTSITLNGLNTQNNTYYYKVEFTTAGTKLGETAIASSVFINTMPNDNQVTISWNEQVPWINYEYAIFRKGTASVTFDSLTTVASQSFTDTELTNGLEYCYLVKSKGSYFTAGLPDLLINNSQEKCDIPIDTTPPCAPDLMVTNDCDREETGEPQTFDSNLLEWALEDEICAEDVFYFNIFYQAPGQQAVLLEQLGDASARSYLHDGLNGTIAGCYYITAVDSFMNESLQSNTICKESCLLYELPNTFTPNGDEMNDLFIPIDGAQFVHRIELEVFNRWGGKVFETENPEILWDGTHFKTGAELPTHVYYYVCKVFELNSNGSERVAQDLSGYIHLFREP